MSLLKKEARARLLETKEESLLDDRDIHRLWELLNDNLSHVAIAGAERRINYEGFQTVAAKMPDKAARFFRAHVILARASSRIISRY
jgi:hypothetical protein